MLLVFKLGRMVTHHKEVWLIKSCDSLFMCYSQIAWQTKTISPLLQYHPSLYMTTTLVRIVAHLKGLMAIKLHDPFITWSSKITWQTVSTTAVSMTTLVTWHHGDLLWRAPSYQFPLTFGDVVWQIDVAKQSHYVFTTSVAMATKLERVVTCL